MPVLPIAILKSLSSASNSSGLLLSKVEVFILYVYDVACEGLSES